MNRSSLGREMREIAAKRARRKAGSRRQPSRGNGDLALDASFAGVR